MVVNDQALGERLLPVVPEFIVTVDHTRKLVVVKSYE
jgi:ribosomal 30S subunit maturation factor RimM